MTAPAVLVLLAIGSARGLAQDAATKPLTPSRGEQMVDQAARQLATWPSLEIRLRQRLELYGQEAVGSGWYLQQQTSRGLMLRLELKLQLAEHMTTLQQVCDGQFLWVRRELPSGTSLGRVDLSLLQEAAEQEDPAPRTDWASAGLVPGGLPRLMTGLRENFQFGEPAGGQSDGTQAWTIVGQWKPEVLAELLPGQAESILAGSAPDLSGLPVHLPSDVRITLRKEDLIPLQIDYRRRSSSGSKSPSTTADTKSILVMDFYSIRQRKDLDERHFVYQPGDQEFVDLTDRYLQRLAPPAEEEVED